MLLKYLFLLFPLNLNYKEKEVSFIYSSLEIPLQIVKHTAINPALNTITNPHYFQQGNSYLPFKKDMTLYGNTRQN